MSEKQAALDYRLQRFVDEGYHIALEQGHLLIKDVPYVGTDRTVKRGTLVSLFTESNGSDTHQVWFKGEFPCFSNGAPIEAIRHSSEMKELFPGLCVEHHFSNKPPNGFPDHYSKLISYVAILSNQARVLDSTATAQTMLPAEVMDATTIFRYPDNASVRNEHVVTTNRLAVKKVAIIGLGGTGSYILDQLAKTPVQEIHLFDGDIFQNHNAFRSPGAATLDEITQEPSKVDYFHSRYDPMHGGIFRHAYYLDSMSIHELVDFDFVFVCVDKGPARALICNFLQDKALPFIDCGMVLTINPDTQSIFGVCRVTLSTESQRDHFSKYAPIDDLKGDALYEKNIQVADINAINALLAVIRWKQFCGFYSTDFNPHQMTYSMNTQSLTRDVFQSL